MLTSAGFTPTRHTPHDAEDRASLTWDAQSLPAGLQLNMPCAAHCCCLQQRPLSLPLCLQRVMTSVRLMQLLVVQDAAWQHQ